jgi:hypothetical protein
MRKTKVQMKKLNANKKEGGKILSLLNYFRVAAERRLNRVSTVTQNMFQI